MKRFLVILILALSAMPGKARAIEVSARVDNRNPGAQEMVLLEVVIRDGHGEVDTSPIKDFQVRDQGTTTSVRIINSQMTQEIQHNYLLIPLKKGRLKIPPLPVRSENRVYKTDPIDIVVAEEPDRKESQNANIFVKAEVSDLSPFTGQQIIFSFKVYTSVQVYNADFQPPRFEGFSSERIGEQKNYRTTISGRIYVVNEVNFLLVPLKAGGITVEPAVLSCSIITTQSRKHRRFPFDSLLDNQFLRGRQQVKVFKSDAITLNVRKLPDYQGSGEFSGLIGVFRMRAGLEKDMIQVGESTTLSVEISGEGNVMDAKMPDFQVPPQFKLYGDTPQENIKLTRSGYEGSKVFKMALVALEPGKFLLPPVRLTYFDIEKAVYKTLESSSRALTAVPSEKEDQLEVTSALPLDRENLGKKKVTFTGRDILPLKESTEAVKSVETMSSLGFFVFILIPPFFFAIAAVGMRLRRKRLDPSDIMAKKARAALKEAKRQGAQSEEFLSLIHKALIWAILAVGGKMGESLTYAEAERILIENGFSNQDAVNISELLKKIESARFGGGACEPSKISPLLDETEKAIGSLT